MKSFRIKLKKRGFAKNSGYEIVVSRIINSSKVDVLAVLGYYNPNYPVRFSFINLDVLSQCVCVERLLLLLFLRLFLKCIINIGCFYKFKYYYIFN